MNKVGELGLRSEELSSNGGTREKTFTWSVYKMKEL